MWSRSLICLIGCGLLVSCKPYDKGELIEREKSKIDGLWRASSITLEAQGRTLDKDEVDTFTVRIGNSTILIEGKLLRQDASMKLEYSYWLDPTTEPKQIDLGFNGTMGPGIYKLDGETLTIRFGSKAGRPLGFETDDPARYTTYVLKRKDAEKK